MKTCLSFALINLLQDLSQNAGQDLSQNVGLHMLTFIFSRLKMEEETENLNAEIKRLSEEYSSMEEIKRDLEEQLQDYMTETSQQVRT